MVRLVIDEDGARVVGLFVIPSSVIFRVVAVLLLTIAVSIFPVSAPAVIWLPDATPLVIVHVPIFWSDEPINNVLKLASAAPLYAV